MFTEYVEKAMKQADYELIEDGTYFGDIPGFDGVWGNGEDAGGLPGGPARRAGGLADSGSLDERRRYPESWASSTSIPAKRQRSRKA